MITAIVNVRTDGRRIPEIAGALAELEGVSEVYSVTGEVDLVVMVRVRRHEELADVIAGGISRVEGITSTTTNIAFRAYSRHDLESAFDLGFD
ncbi:Lrp/AsnC family transcriptional regulator [Kineococcus esterisolvens]|uniref:Lrp/AsnC family transcriptional regulator n=1 Tax=unclassified Kineococcus TaxID=2621656 RepID=UPI003D7DF4CF